MVTAAMKFKILAPWKQSYNQPGHHIKKQRPYLADKVPSSQSYGFSNSRVWCESWIEKAGLKLNIRKSKIMASGPITAWQVDGETMEKVTDFILGGSKITADGDCRHEIKRHLLLGRTAMTNLDSI